MMRRFFFSTVKRVTAGLRILLMGDSIAAGRNNSTGVGPTPTAGTVKQWNGSAWIDVTNTDVVTATASNGSPWPQMGIDLNTSSGEVVYLFPTGVSSSMFHTNAGYTTWQKGGTNYTAMLAYVANGLADLGPGHEIDAICVILGINDVVVSSTLADVETAIDDFFADLVADFPGVPILVSQPGRKATGSGVQFSNTDRFYAVRFKINENAINHADVHIVGCMGSLAPAGGYSTDDLHPNLLGDNYLGGMFASWFVNSAYSKWARSVLSSMYGSLSALRSGLLADFIDSQVASGNYFLFEQLGFFVQTDVKNVYVDLAMMGMWYAPAAGTYVANSHIATNGSNQHWTPTQIPSINIRRQSQNDFIEGWWLKDNVGAAATSIMAGIANASVGRWIGQTSAVGSRHLSNDNTASVYATDLALLDNTVYSIARDAGNAYLIKESTIAATAVKASTGLNTQFCLIGARNNTGASTVDFYFNGQWRAHWVAKYVGFDLSSFVTELRYLGDHWND